MSPLRCPRKGGRGRAAGGALCSLRAAAQGLACAAASRARALAPRRREVQARAAPAPQQRPRGACSLSRQSSLLACSILPSIHRSAGGPFS
eukprot:scaffold4409_cov369-Prasinococcus_capsulatus_cf.AAC.4